MSFQINCRHFRISRGQSVIELIVAVAIFAIIAATSVTAILSSFSTTRLAQEETQAALLAVEGFEAVESIRNQDWNNVTNGNHGLSISGGNWVLSGTSDTTGKFIRVITITDVLRDTNGNIASSGIADDETKYITARVTWNFTPTRQNTVEMISYLTNWQEGRSSGDTSPGPITSCTQYCTSIGFTSGTCRASSQQCINNNELPKPIGDQYCTGVANADTCCCLP